MAIALRVDAASAVVTSAPAQWALGELEDALRQAGIAVAEGGDPVHVLGADSADAARRAAAAHIALPDVAESFALFRDGDAMIAIGADARGLVYALTELADRVRHPHGPLFGTEFPLVAAPATKIRSISRLFANEREDKPWFHDKSHWIAYLTMLATQRFNRFSLALGMQYDYPYHNHIISDVYLHFPYPYLVNVPGYGIKVLELPESERETNLDMLRFIGREAAKRGLDFQLGLWTQRYDFDDVPNANYTVVGATDENIGPYCRDAIAMLLAEVPEITGLTFRIHVEGGISEGNYDFWRMAFAGVKSSGRPILIDMHAKGLDATTLDVALETGLPVGASPKYLAEHVGLPYHTSAIREREYPPAEAMTNREKLSVGSRRFLRQSYGDLLPAGKRWKLVFRVWPGTQRVLAWGDPALAAGYGRSANFAGADGIEWMEPMSFKGRQGTGIAGGRQGYRAIELATRYDWEKYALQYRLWGRLSYAPDAGPESWQRYLATLCGDAAGDVATALAAASKILPLVTQAHGPSIANNNYWPEIYTNIGVLGDNFRRPYGADTDAPVRFGNASTFDPQLLANARHYAAALVSGEALRAYTPMDVADWLERFAEAAELALIKIKAAAAAQRPAVRRLTIDAGILAALGRFFAAKFRAACWAELYLLTHQRETQLQLIDQLGRARDGWLTAAKLSEDVYPRDITFGPGPNMRGSWHTRAAEIDREWKDARAFQFAAHEESDVDAATAAKAIERLHRRQPVRNAARQPEAPASFTPGQDIVIGIAADIAPGAQYVLHYRHVNQGERWQSLPMRGAGDHATATIPAAYTASEFHLQYYLSAVAGESVVLVPGFAESLADMPYLLIPQQDSHAPSSGD